MNQNISKTLVALQCLGLDLNEGCSDLICLTSLEKLSGIRQNSNGSRIIRRDCKVFSKFKIDYLYSEGGSVIGFKFNGYKDSIDLITEASMDIIRYKEKLEQTFVLLEEAELRTRELIGSSYFKYSKLDIT